MKIRLTKSWSGYPPGHVFSTMHTGMQHTLVSRGYAEIIEPDMTARIEPTRPVVKNDIKEKPDGDGHTRTKTEPTTVADKPVPSKPGGRKKAARNRG